MSEVDFMVLTREAKTGFLRLSTVGILGWRVHNTHTSQHSNTVSRLLFQGPGAKVEKHFSGAGKGLITMVDL